MAVPELEIRRITPAQTYPLRHAVLWPDKPLDYVKVENDAAGQHFGAFVQEELVSVISLFVTGPDARFRKFATAPEWQKQGIGSRLLQCIMEEARQQGAQELWCDARQDAAAFYQRFGMVGQGPVFYKGDIPYLRMSLQL
ncbi:GNAT family N-acetyltransferase [Hymenobacter cellulosilyticus]|uniref:GNAT family N-acetyltransferase n=1 Tax=Hymenobacter cellulosilyticus TaxID=2932248 RepID=A0A8T9QA37_9BACT|nr:GNAT family N-acetyltransferase [Hymenobacter cellulosilyticus]UOQ72379.1 GNAT family N-acetyltransferase [Hymenobacter cellulosilyticus]